MKTILVTNDDGFDSAGIRDLARTLKQIAKVIVVAPSTQKSACGHSVTCTRPLKFLQVDDDYFKLDDATPADCVYLGIHAFFKDSLPDLIVSGINNGANLGEDITYSGTCGGAMQGVLQGVPSLAVSQLYAGDSLERYGFDLGCEIALSLVEKIFKDGFPLPKKQFLNLNIPAVSKKGFKGIKVAPMGEKIYSTAALMNKNPYGEEYYWLGELNMNFDANLNAQKDLGYAFDGYATLTPIMLDLTSYKELKGLENWIK
ncbi:MAG: 5'/3'-nucleotidase SurE [Campylobacter sp.]|nr:5'/3'-nucleotidase SurE [Campylobacter sp.]